MEMIGDSGVRTAARAAPGRIGDVSTFKSVSRRNLSRYADHPTDAKTIGDHAKARRPESLTDRHLHLAALGQGGKFAVGLRFIWCRQRERKTFEVGVAGATPIRRHHGGVADAHADVHDLVLGARRDCSRRRWLWAVLVAH